MHNFPYKASVIIPVYNTEDYLRNCLNSLVNQTVDMNQIEVLLINDGSTDMSASICEEYSEIYGNFKFITKENEGVSATRNLGLKLAQGEYIFFLDSDDTLESKTIQLVMRFFEQHNKEVDMVCYYDQYYENGQKLAPHPRYKYLQSTGIYDLNENPFIMQVRLSMCIKNNKCYYFNEEIGYQEDQLFCSEVLGDKMKIGFVKEAQYNYMKNDSSIVATQTNAIQLYENSTRIFESLFTRFEEVPTYYQALFFHDVQWKFSSGCLYPYHYEEAELLIAKERIHKLLSQVDVDVIMSHPGIDNYQKLFWVREKDKYTITPIFEEGRMSIYNENHNIYERGNVEIILKRVWIMKNDKVKFVGYFKSPLFPLVEKPKFIMINNGRKSIVDVHIASNSYYKAKERTDMFYSFSIECKVDKISEIYFQVEIDGICYETAYWMDSFVPFSGTVKLNKFADNEISVEKVGNKFILTKVSQERCDEIITGITNSYRDAQVKHNREFYRKNRMEKIWLYVDNYATPYDNAWYQFEADFEKQDGITRYYVVTNEQIYDYINQEKYKENLIPFGSHRHKMLFLVASKLLAAFIELEVCFPFYEDIKYYADLLNIEVIYLQHGVLHAHLPWYYAPTNVIVDKEVVSSKFELDNLSANYGFERENLIPCGMSRYDHIDRSMKPERKILFAPSWRSYLIGRIRGGSVARAGNDSKFQESAYYQGIMAFATSEKLNQLLIEANVTLEIKMHPEFLSTYGDALPEINSNVIFVRTKVNVAEYAMFITDFSSFVFDYGVLKRPIAYFMPDIKEFTSGMNNYRLLDLPFEKAFGRFTTEVEEIVSIIEKVITDDFVMEPLYRERVEKFYLPLENCCESLYEYLIHN